MFSKEDLTNPALSTYQECRLAHYLCCIRDSLNRLSPPLSRTGSPILNMQAYTLDYVARGMGLVTASKNRKASFYLYPTAQQVLEPGEISIQIKGPVNSFGSMLIPAIYGKTHIVRNVFYNLGHRQSLKDMQLPISRNSTYNNHYGASSNYLMPKLANDIEISILISNDRVKVFYTPKEIGYHELSMISKGCHIMGSPFRINVEEERIERSESRDYEEEIYNAEPLRSDRKIVFRIVDFVTEKMILTEDGTLESISDEEADALMRTVDSLENMTMKCLQYSNEECALYRPDLIKYNQKQIEVQYKSKKHFNIIAKKVLLMLRICKELRELAKLIKMNDKQRSESVSTPDIVNSTRKEENFIKSAGYMRNIYKNKPTSLNETNDTFSDDNNIGSREESSPHNHTAYPIIDIVISSFDDDEIENIIDIPVIEELPERPKTPVFKILTADDEDEARTELYNNFNLQNYAGQFDSLNSDSLNKEEINLLSNPIENLNTEKQSSIDFHIGEPVSPTCMMNTPNVDGDMDSIILASNLEEALLKYDNKIQKTIKDREQYPSDNSSSTFTTPLRQTPFEQMTDNEILQMYEGSPQQEADLEQPTNRSSEEPKTLDDSENGSLVTSRGNSCDTWDSAYMSIDEINSSPESSSTSPKNDQPSKSKLFAIKEAEGDIVQSTQVYDEIDHEAYSKMGPAEKELWESVTQNENLKETHFNCLAVSQPYSRIIKREINIPTPINEDEIYNKITNPQNELTKTMYVLNDGSASDNTADVKRSVENNHSYFQDKLISSIQTLNAELIDASQIVNNGDVSKDEALNKIQTKKSLSRMVSEKKDYWDDMIKSIEITEDEKNRALNKKSTLLRKNDSLSIKRDNQTTNKVPRIENRKKYNTEPVDFESLTCSGDESLVTRWKKFWNERIESMPTPESNVKYIRKELAKKRKYLTSPEEFMSNSFSESMPFLERNDVTESPYASKSSSKKEDNKKYRAKSMSMSNLSERIDKYLDTVSTPTMMVDLDDSRFSTPDDSVTKPQMTMSVENNLLKIEKDDNKLVVTWDESSNERRIKALQNISNRSTPLISENKNNTDILNCDEHISLPTYINENVEMSEHLEEFSVDVRSKIEILRDKARQSFIQNKSKTIDIPREASFKSLKKYFSLEKIEPTSSTFNNIKRFNKINKSMETIQQPNNVKVELNVSTESIPTLSEKKARIELHLQSIQNRLKIQASNNSQIETNQNQHTIQIKSDDTVICGKNDDEIKEELKKISKPIGSIVAAFEQQHNTLKVKPSFIKNKDKSSVQMSKLDADSPEGTNGTEIQNLLTVLSVTPKDIAIDDNIKNPPAAQIGTDTKNESQEQLDEADNEIRSSCYRERFQQAKAFFQTLDEPKRKPYKINLNECEQLLQVANSDINDNDPKIEDKHSKEKRGNLKRSYRAFSAPTSDTETDYSKYMWKRGGSERLMKISEKFLVHDLFRDVAGGSTKTRYTIFKGIPHKNAVLATFQSMENINQLSSYDYTESQIEDFAKNNNIINIQTYHSEYPHLPTTDPSKYRSRFDAAASGLILRKDMLKLQKMRRNSAPSNIDVQFSHYVNI